MADHRIPSTGAKNAAGPAKHVKHASTHAPAPAPHQAAAPEAPKGKPGVTAGADSTIAKGLGTGNLHDLDALLEQAVAKTAPAAPPATPPKNENVAVIEDALQLPARPSKPEDQKAWAMDGYRRLLKAETAFNALEKDWGSHKVDGNTLSLMRSKLWNAKDQVTKVDKDGALKKEFFSAILPPAQAIVDGLKDYPAPPADKAGKQAWLAEGRKKLDEARAAEALMKDAWFDFNALDFNKMADGGQKLFEFEMKLDRVADELNPPKPLPPSPRRPGQPSAGPSGPLFGNTQGVADALNKHPNNPVVQVGGAVALPIALTIDVIDAITRPFVWLDQVSGKH